MSETIGSGPVTSEENGGGRSGIVNGGAPGAEVAGMLDQLEQRLQGLEGALASVAVPPRVAGHTWDTRPPDASAARLLSEARSRIGGLSGQLDELLRFRDQLERSVRELASDYDRLQGTLDSSLGRDSPGADAPEAGTLGTPPPPFTYSPPPIRRDPQVPPGREPGASPHEVTVFEGQVTVDAGRLESLLGRGTLAFSLREVGGGHLILHLAPAAEHPPRS